ncbi:MAG: ABC transporter permease [Acidimicrobiales bacterium]
MIESQTLGLGTPGPSGEIADAKDQQAVFPQSGRAMLRTFAENRAALGALVVVVLMVLACFLGPVFYVTDQVHTNLAIVNHPPSAAHLLGTDQNGYDILGRLMVGGQSSIEIGLAVALISTAFGALWGAFAGFVGGAADAVMMRVVDTVLAVPWLFLFIFLATVFRPTVLLLIVVLSVLSWLGPARLIRGETLSLRTREYVLAARGMGGKPPRILVRHILPNAIGTIVVNATFQIVDAILALATLSFLGFGLPPPAATWGGMLSQGVNYLFDGYWWEVYPAGICIVLTVAAVNYIGDALRDALDVRLQRR